MTNEVKQKLIENQQPIIEALNSLLDSIYNMTDSYFTKTESGELKLKEDLTTDPKVEAFVKELNADAQKYEKVRRKIIDSDFDLSSQELTVIMLAFHYSEIRMEKRIKLFTDAKELITDFKNFLLKNIKS